MLSTVKDGYVEESEVFGPEQGFALAVGLVNEDIDEPLLDPSIASFRMQAISWGLDDQDEYFYEEKDLDLHLCTPEELGLVPGDSMFMPIKESTSEELELMSGKMWCLKREDSHIYGNY